MLAVVVVAALAAAPPLARGAHRDLRDALSGDAAVAAVDVSRAAAVLRDAGCSKARFIVAPAAKPAARTAEGPVAVPARALGFDHRGQACAHDVVVDVSYAPRRAARR